MLSNRKTAGCPAKLPGGHLGRIWHQRWCSGEVLTKCGAITKGTCIADQVVCAKCYAKLRQRRVRRASKCLAQRNSAHVLVGVVVDGSTAKLHSSWSRIGGVQRGGVRINTSRKCNGLKRRARGVERLGSSVDQLTTGTGLDNGTQISVGV